MVRRIAFPIAVVCGVVLSLLSVAGVARGQADARIVGQVTDAMFRGGAPGANPGGFAPLQNSKAIIIDGDHDVFGDGTVILKSTPGHTPGHQSLFVRLARTGPVMLSGDLYHFPAERTFNKMPDAEAARGQTGASRDTLERFIREQRATLWIQHDIIAFAKLKRSPAYYD
jgi:glyoxylase-like metal-dependent hydrolase (beta-lactamase superfamily II)